MLQLTITDPTEQELETVRELLDHWVGGETPLPTPIPPPVPSDLDFPSIPATKSDPGFPTGQVPSTPELDKNGMPWDERIHSSNHQLTKEGVWRAKRGVSEELVKQVEGQLKGVTPSKELTKAFEVIENLPPAPPVVPPSNPMGPFVALVSRAMAAIGANTLTKARLDEVCQKHGVSSLPALGQRPELVAPIEAELFP